MKNGHAEQSRFAHEEPAENLGCCGTGGWWNLGNGRLVDGRETQPPLVYGGLQSNASGREWRNASAVLGQKEHESNTQNRESSQKIVDASDSFDVNFKDQRQQNPGHCSA